MTQIDLDEAAAALRNHIDNRASRFMPQPVLLTVKDRAPRSSLGWVLCDHEGRTVRALVPGNWNLEGGIVLFAFPPNQPSEPFVVFGAYDSANGSDAYVPPLVAPTYSTVDTSTGTQTPVQTTDQLVKVSSDDTTAGYLNGKAVAGVGIGFTEGSGGGNETLTIALSYNVRVVTAAGDITGANSDLVIVVNKASGAATTVNLPAGTTGKMLIVKDGKGDAASNNITLDGNSSETIDGAATYVMSTNYQVARIVWNGTQWNLI